MNKKETADLSTALLSKNISRKGPRNRRSLGCARDDKGKGNGSIESSCWTEAFFITLGGPQAHDNSVEKHLQEGSAEPQVPPLRFPGFPVDLDGVGGPHAPFLKRKAHTRPCLAQRGRKSGFASVGMTRKG